VSEIESFFEETAWTAGVVGLGYVGLPLAVSAARRGLGVAGIDTLSVYRRLGIDPDNVTRL
jgi:UDP-N-acetyl-D-mannosaminuronate dehydrogenase